MISAKQNLLCLSASHSDSRTTSNVQQIDNRLTTGSGDILGLNNNTISLSGTGAALNITSANAEIAKAGLDTARSLASASNAIAGQVADSQRAFVETASGQKTWIVTAIIVGIVALFFFWRKH